jgi:cytochrome P450
VNALPSPRGLPLIGNAHQLGFLRLHATLERWAKELGPLYAVRLGPRPLFVASSPEVVRTVLRERPEQFRRMRQIEEVSHELHTLGVFSAEGAAWKRQRNLIVPTFANAPLKSFWPAFREVTERLRRRWLASNGAPVDVLADLRCFTVDVTTRLVFGRDLNTLERGSGTLTAAIETVFAGLGRRVVAPLPYWRYVTLPTDRQLMRAVDAVTAEVSAIIAAAHQKLDHGGEPDTLLETMLVARDDADPKLRFSDHEVLGNALTLLLAGEDTTANTIAWLLYYLAVDPALQAHVRAESRAVLGAETTLAGVEQTQALRTIGAATLETLRLRSPSPVMFLEANQATELSGCAIPRGGQLVLLTRAAEISELGADGGSFRPERWLGANAREAWAAARSSLAFGDGPRMCPGRNLALVECAMVAAMVCGSFSLAAVGEAREVLKFVMQPEGLRLRFEHV